MPYNLRHNEDSLKIKYTIKLGGICLDFVKPEGMVEHNSVSEDPTVWAATLLGFLFCSKPDLHNMDCQHPLSESAYTMLC